jgi:hypothetical protein
VELDLAVLLFRTSEPRYHWPRARCHTVGELKCVLCLLCRTAQRSAKLVVVGLLHGVVEAMAKKDVRLHGLAGRLIAVKTRSIRCAGPGVRSRRWGRYSHEPICVHAVCKADAQLPAGPVPGCCCQYR